MASNRARAAARASSGPAFEIKGTIAPVTVLCLRTTDLSQIERELRARVEPAPQLFLNAPVVIDVADVEEGTTLPLAEVVASLRQFRLVPVGVAHLSATDVGQAAEVGLAIVQLGFGRSRGARANSPGPVAPAVAAPPPPAPVKAVPPPPEPRREAGPTLTLNQPVRGGQVSYAQHGDLVVLAQVNPGAQVIADGHVHVYGRLRGRALAGARGQAAARVFCQSLEAELVAIAGEFLTAEDIPGNLRGKPAQIFIEKGVVRAAPL